jgi:glycosyltransferase involved in cell wall biosynthesis
MTCDAVGGVWNYSTTLAGALAKRGCEVLLVTLGPAPLPDQLASLSGDHGLALEVTDYALEWMDPEARDVERARAGLAKIAARFRPDLVQINGYREAAFDWNSPVLVAAHSCVWTWWQACRGSRPDEPRWSIYADHVRTALDTARAWVAPTEAFRAEIERAYRPKKRGEVIHNGIAKPSVSRREKEPFILAAGRLWDEAKNTAALARIAEEIGWPVKLVGPLQNLDCAAAAESLGRMPHDGLLELMARAAIYASPALYEPFGLSVLEAAASGCALVLSDIPTHRELWSGAALFVDPDDDRELAATLRFLCEDPSLLEQLQARARSRSRRYSREAMLSSYLSLYRRILDAPARSSQTAAPLESVLRA